MANPGVRKSTRRAENDNMKQQNGEAEAEAEGRWRFLSTPECAETGEEDLFLHVKTSKTRSSSHVHASG